MMKEEPAPEVIKDTHPLKVNVIAAISKHGKSKIHIFTETMDSAIYIKYLKKIANEFNAGVLKEIDWTLVKDSAKFHVSRYATAEMEKLGIHFISQQAWPANSPDFNAIENTWSILKSDVQSLEPKNKKQLERAIRKVWNKIPQSTVNKCIDALKGRLKQAIRNKGEQTN